MANVAEIRGVANVVKAIQRKGRTSVERLTHGLEMAGHFLLRESQLVVPIDTGNLRGGGFRRTEDANTLNVRVLVGYVAAYAIYVHEMMDVHHQPGKQAKYLTGPMHEKNAEIKRIVQAAMKGMI